MGNETTYSGVLGMLGWLATALGANATELAHLDGARLRLAKNGGDAEGTAQQQAAFMSSKREASKKLRDLFVAGLQLEASSGEAPKSPGNLAPAPPAAYAAADANPKP
ncbi:MAG TPA: hypothetical protein VLX28_04050 [Thermoanaerobaculia bacterium]|nr:hypothetical protein [Thermoanaerobaculia bacterium]